MANKYWAPHSAGKHVAYNPDIVEDIYMLELRGSNFSTRRIMMLEFSQYLENYLWPNFDPATASQAHVMSIIIMVNEKFRERVPAWTIFQENPKHFQGFFQKLMQIALDDSPFAYLPEQASTIIFLNHCFNGLEVDVIREQVQRLVSLPTWICLQEGRREQELENNPRWKKYWKAFLKKDSKVPAEDKEKLDFERRFLKRLIEKFLGILEKIPQKGRIDEATLHYCERFLELLVDLEALLPTRRFFNTVLDDSHLVVKCSLSALNQRPEGELFTQLLEMLKFYTCFEINDETGDPLTDRDMMELHYGRITSLQRAAFVKFPDLRRFALSNVASVDTRETLVRHFEPLSAEVLYDIAAFLKLVPPRDKIETDDISKLEKWMDKNFLLQLLVSRHEKRSSQLQALNEMPLYPTEEIIWNEALVPNEYFSGDACLALPKLHLQFLTLHDYLLRNFNLFRLETTYEIRQDIEDALSRLRPWVDEYKQVTFSGWSRMAQPIINFAIVEVGKPNIGERQPSRVRADVSMVLNVRDVIKKEWEALRKHDPCFLITVRPTLGLDRQSDESIPFAKRYGVVAIRGCEIEGMLDQNGRVIEEGPEPKPELPGDMRSFRVWLDCNQYRVDMEKASAGGLDIYDTFNIIMRRRPKENNFKAVLETIRDLMNTDCVVPDWLHDIVLGYGNPGAAHYAEMPNEIPKLDFCDTFLDFKHLEASFPGYEIRTGKGGNEGLKPPFRLTFEEVLEKRKNPDCSTRGQKIINVDPYTPPNPGPYPFNKPKTNAVHFTPTQVEAIRSGMQPGLTLVVGPPGTGKTDVAVQIISNIYHNFPEQRTLIVTHSNMALNQLFEKIMALDVDERHLLRLGHGEEALETEKDFSRYGRVNYVLAKRLDLLQEVQRLQESLEVPGDVAYTCETAGYFYMQHVLARWQRFLSIVKPSSPRVVSVEDIANNFPFTVFFANAPQPLFKGKIYDEDMDIAEGCF
ncbi:hypothetical protein QYM36_007331, partial [Artemia franciscana]